MGMIMSAAAKTPKIRKSANSGGLTALFMEAGRDKCVINGWSETNLKSATFSLLYDCTY